MGMSNITTRVNNQFPRPDLHRLDKQPYRLQTKSTKFRIDSQILPDLRALLRKFGWGQGMRLPRPSPPNVLIGGPVRIPPGFPLKACGNDGLIGELGVEGHTPFSFSVGEHKLDRKSTRLNSSH